MSSSIYVNGHKIRVILEKDAESLFPYIKEILLSMPLQEDADPDAVLYVSTIQNPLMFKKGNLDPVMREQIVMGGRFFTGSDLLSKKAIGRYFISIKSLSSGKKDILRTALINVMNIFSRECFFVTNTLMFHAASVEKDGRGYLFLGPSGSGKTTICQLSGSGRVIHDEMSVVRPNRGGYLIYPGYAHGCPYPMRPIKGALLRAIFFIQKSSSNSVERMPLKDSFINGLVQCQNYLFEKRDRFAGIHNNLIDFLKEAEIFKLRFKKDDSFWDCLAEHVN